MAGNYCGVSSCVNILTVHECPSNKGASAVGFIQTFWHQCIIFSHPLFCSCRWSHVELHDDTEMLVSILLPLPDLKKFEYVSSWDFFLMLYSWFNPMPHPGPL